MNITVKTIFSKTLFLFFLLLQFAEQANAENSKYPVYFLRSTPFNTIHPVQPGPAVSISATATNICSGKPVIFTAHVTGASSTAKWIWRKNNKVLTTVYSSTYTDASLNDKDIIDFLLVTPRGSSFDTITSNAFTMQITKIPNTLKDTIKVDGDSVILDAGPGNSSYKWNSGDTTQKITVIEFGNYTVTLTNQSGCTASYNSYVSLVKARIFNKDTIVCPGSPVTISLGRIKDAYDTSVVDKFTVSLYGYFNKSIKTSVGGRYFYKVSGTGSFWSKTCDTLDAFYALTLPSPTYRGKLCIGYSYFATPSPLAYNPSHCYTSTVFNTGSTPIQFSFTDIEYSDNCGSFNFTVYKISPRPLLHILWSTGDTTATINVTPTITTTYYVSVTDGITTSRDSMTITVKKPVTPSVFIKASTLDTCTGTTILFAALPVNGGAAPHFQWKVNGNNTGTDAGIFTTSSLADKDVVSCVMLSSAACVTEAVNSNPLPIDIHTYITPSVTIQVASTHICEGGSFTFTAHTTNEGESPAYQWLVNNKNTGLNSSVFTSASLADKDVVRCMTAVKSDLRCLTSKEAVSEPLAVTVYPNPRVSAGDDREVLKGQQTRLNGSISGEAAVKWSPTCYLTNDTIINPLLTPLQNTTYTINAVSAYGCTAAATVKVKVLDGLTIPNVFSPNGDGINDTWQIAGFQDFPAASLTIFNRYGQPVFQSAGYKTAWTGEINGAPLPVATYYYVINLGDQFKPVSGSVTIIR